MDNGDGERRWIAAIRNGVVFSLVLLFASAAGADISELSWLSGCWAYEDAEAGSGEYWTPPAGDSMLAVSRTIRNGTTVAFEYLRIEEIDDDSFALFASPSGKPATRFDMIRISTTEIVFENVDHDFPQRIIYRLQDEKKLLGRIEGQSDGREVVVDFPMTLVDCQAFGL